MLRYSNKANHSRYTVLSFKSFISTSSLRIKAFLHGDIYVRTTLGRISSDCRLNFNDGVTSEIFCNIALSNIKMILFFMQTAYAENVQT